MRLALALGKSLAEVLELSEAERALWQAWERCYGTLGPERDDRRAAHHEAHAARRQYAIAGLKERDLKQITADKHLAFVPWDGLDEDERAQTQREQAEHKRKQETRATLVAQVIRTLMLRGQAERVNAWMGRDGNWTGPLSVEALDAKYVP
jgi:hypothetical protein